MPNTWFKFKQFTICQQEAAMKVCTDACLFGAWVVDRLGDNSGKSVLDIGTGTGLLALMVAQKTKGQVQAIEISETAYIQAKENVVSSPFRDRVEVIWGDVRQYSYTASYDLIICNPPFYEGDLKSPDTGRNTALHSLLLTFDELISTIDRLLAADGFFAVLLPYKRHGEFKRKAFVAGLHPRFTSLVKHTEQHPFFRAMLIFSKKEGIEVRGEISIRHGNEYSPEFSRLLRDYYLFL